MENLLTALHEKNCTFEARGKECIKARLVRELWAGLILKARSGDCFNVKRLYAIDKKY